MEMHQVTQKICDGELLKWLFASGFAWLEHNQDHVNALNVFPVPDGDTGTNMRLTMQKAYDAIAHVDDKRVSHIASQFARGALLGARGNSGVILSQLLRGFADGLGDAADLDVPLFAQAAQRAVETAYAAVIDPVEGTMLTVAREAPEALTRFAESNDDLCAALDTVIDAARDSLDRTPDLLPVLKEAGVHDSGGQGLLYILEGMSRSVSGLPVKISDDHASNRHANGSVAPTNDDESYGYDVQFLMYGSDMHVESIRHDLDAMGWSTLVVGDSDLIKVHIHVHDPGEPLSYAVSHCDALDDVVVENMQRQYEQIHGPRDGDQQVLKVQQIEGVGVIAVASGPGLQHVFYESQAAHVISGGQTMNPSTEDFLKAIHALDNRTVVLLPNNKNIVLAAEQAAREATQSGDRIVKVVPTTTVPQGISAMLAYLDVHTGSADSLSDVVEMMHEAMTLVVSGEITTATRDAHLNHIDVEMGKIIGLVNGKLVVSADDLSTAVKSLLEHADIHDHELVTLYYGTDVTEEEAESLLKTLEAAYTSNRFHLIDGGQPLYPYLVSLE